MVNMPSKYEEDGHNSSDSEYNVEEFVQPKRVRQTVNDESADLLGNFDDAKRRAILEGTYTDPVDNGRDTSDTEVSSEDEVDDGECEAETHKVTEAEENSSTDVEEDVAVETSEDDEHETTHESKNNLSKEQLASLLRGASKTNRYVLYVTNLDFASTKDDLLAHFSAAGIVKSVRIPKKRSSAFAFVEMFDMEGFQSCFRLHNTELQGRRIKVQISEAGKKKSANKKNIIKQKNRKLAEMRNEQKTFTKSGKFYDKTLKKEKAKEMLARKRWRKPAVTTPRVNPFR